MIKSIEKKSIYEEITLELIRLIKEKHWGPGDKIMGEKAMAEAFGVSRNSVREALKALEISGLIETRQGSGTFVSKDSAQNINRLELVNTIKETNSFNELMETRLIIEPQLVCLACLRATDEELDELSSLVDENRRAALNEGFTLDMGLGFHRRIMELSGNKILYMLP